MHIHPLLSLKTKTTKGVYFERFFIALFRYQLWESRCSRLENSFIHRVTKGHDLDLFFFFFFFGRQKADRRAPKHKRQFTTWQVFRQVERRFHSRDSNCQPFPWDLGIPLPSPGSLRSSRTRSWNSKGPWNSSKVCSMGNINSNFAWSRALKLSTKWAMLKDHNTLYGHSKTISLVYMQLLTI